MPTTTALFLVEDDALIRELLEASLSGAGFEGVEVSCGTKALAHFEADAGRFRAVITDIHRHQAWCRARRLGGRAPGSRTRSHHAGRLHERGQLP
jgi:DNA-binding response OmpR family regulator